MRFTRLEFNLSFRTAGLFDGFDTQGGGTPRTTLLDERQIIQVYLGPCESAAYPEALWVVMRGQ